MRLPRPFYRLPVRFDAARLQAELEALPDIAWARHPKEFEGNASIRLISVDGAENDTMRGVMRPTPHLQACPYVRQVLASFGVVWSRSRFMRLSARSNVPEHADTSYHWFSRVRMHIPVVTWPEVRFSCGDESVHMAAGEAWLFDNWRRHSVVNPTDKDRVHLVADTSGTSTFWQHVAQSAVGAQDRTLPYRPELDAAVLTERAVSRPVLPPAEVELLVQDLIGELRAAPDAPGAAENVPKYAGLLLAFCRDWRQVYALHGESAGRRRNLSRSAHSLQDASRPLAHGLVMRTNLFPAHGVLESRVLSHALRPEELRKSSSGPRAASRPVAAGGHGVRLTLERPIFIVAAPRSGSTLLFETLAVSPSLSTLGGEAHWLVEGIAELRPGAPGVDSNRLQAEHATESVAREIDRVLVQRMVDSNQRPVAPGATAALAREDAEERAAGSVLRPPVRRRAVRLPLARSAREPEQHHGGVEGRSLGHVSDTRRLGRTVVDAAAARLAGAQGSSAAGDCSRPVGDHEPHGAHGPAQPAGAALDGAALLRTRRESAAGRRSAYADSRARVRRRAGATRCGSTAGVEAYADAAGA